MKILGGSRETSIDKLSELLNKIWSVKRLSEFGMRKDEIREFAEEIYINMQGVLATNYVPLSVDELAEINRVLY